MIHIIGGYFFEYDVVNLKYDLFMENESGDKDFTGTFDSLKELCAAVVELETDFAAAHSKVTEISEYIMIMKKICRDVNDAAGNNAP